MMDFHGYPFLSSCVGKEYPVSSFTDDTALELTLRFVVLFILKLYFMHHLTFKKLFLTEESST